MSKSIASLSLAAILALSLPVAALPPLNDVCVDATTIPGLELPFARVLDTTQTTADGDPAMACVTPAPGKSVWYKFRPETADAYAFDTAGSTPSDYAPVLALYTGSCGGLTPVAGACARGRLVASLNAGTTYYLLVAGAAVEVDPAIRIALNGVDLCSGGPGPGGGDCGTSFDVHVGDQLSARAYNQFNDSLLTLGAFSWSLGTYADPATATGPSTPFRYTAPVASTNVVMTWTPPGQAPISRQVTMHVSAAGSLSLGPVDLSGPLPLAAGETTTIPSAGGQLRLLVERDAPSWRNVYILPSVASTVNSAGIPYVSDYSVTNLDSTETIVGLNIWTSAGHRESSLIHLAAGGSKTLPDVVRTAFGLEQTFGALLISSTGNVASGARTWAPVSGGGTNGQFLTAGDARNASSAAVLATGEVGVLTGIRQDSAFRTNIGVYNLSEKECVVEVQARDEDGHAVGPKAVLTVPATRYVQQVLGDLTGNNLHSGAVMVTNATSGCTVGSVAYVIDNITQDPFAVPQRKKP